MQITLTNNRFILDFTYNPSIIAYVKTLGGKLDGVTKKWWIPGHETEKADRLAAKFCKENPTAARAEQVGQNEPLPELSPEHKEILQRELLRQCYPYQERGVAYSLKNKRVINGDDMGGGKELVNSTPVLSEKGWVSIGDLETGDLVCGKDGNLHNVTGVFPQGVKDIYRVTFSDGTFADAGLAHLWSIRSGNDRKRRGGAWRTHNTDFIMNNLRYKNGSPIWEIPLCEPINYVRKLLPISPYILGVLIADGAIQRGLRFVPGDKEVPELVKNRLPVGYKLVDGADYGTSTAYYISRINSSTHNALERYIKESGLNVTGDYKFIPTIYLYGSIDQRKELLAGLMDCDGEANGARSRYSTGSLRLAKDVVDLVQSLGGIATMSKTEAKTKNRNGKECFEQEYYRITILTHFNPFGKETARAKWKVSSKLIRQITSIEFSYRDEATCIAVDAPDHLYIIKDHIVTHNTQSTIATIVAAGLKNKCGLIICKSTLKYTWEREFKVVAGMKSIIMADSVKTSWYQFYTMMGVSVFITNFESLEKFFVTRIDKEKGKALSVDNIVWKIHPTTGKAMKDLFDYVVVDESHEIRTEDTVKSVVTRGIGRGKEWRIALSGTCIVNKAFDVYAQLDFLGHTKNTPESRQHFIDRYCGGNGGKSTNMKELNYLLSKYCYFRRNKKEFEIELPDLTMQLIYSDITTRKEYNHCANDLASYLKNIRGRTDGQIEKSMNGEIMVQIQALMNISARGKLRDAIEAIDEVLAAGRKVVVGINQREIKEALKKHYPNFFVISGEENASQKNDAEQAFKHLQGAGGIIVSIKAGGVGINLQTSSDIICIENPWHPAIFYQFIARVHRNGQKNKVNAKVLIGKDTFDERIWEIIESKKDIADSITGSDDSDIQRQVIDKVK